MTTLHMETDSVRALAIQIKQAAEALRSQTQALSGSAQSTDWLGFSHDEFLTEVEGVVRQLDVQAETGLILAGRVESEVAEWESAAASFGVVSMQAILDRIQAIVALPLIIWQTLNRPRPSFVTQPALDAKPTNMKGLAKAVDDLYSTQPSTPIRVIQTGENEYLILIAGTQAGGNANNWNSALNSGVGLPSDFQNQIKAVLMGLPAGAMINMAGHSQGGIMGNNLAGDPDVQNHLKVKSVTTFGAPVSAEPQEGVVYKRYAAWGDAVPLGSTEAVDVLTANVFNIGKEVGDLQQHMIPGSFNPVEAHGMYAGSDALSSETLPFEINQWNESTYHYAAQSSASIPVLDKPL